jgi:hypothetical protein
MLLAVSCFTGLLLEYSACAGATSATASAHAREQSVLRCIVMLQV